jgi:4,5-dihydroxyphthalate decarboxylase
MAEFKLKTVTRTQGNNRAVKEGKANPGQFLFDFEEVPVLVQAFRRMVRNLEFDVCEMAFTTYLCAKAHGKRFTALPIFLVRGFHHGAIAYNTRSGIQTAKDFEGRRVGVNRGYTVTTGVWARGILADEYGVDLDRVTWAPSGDEHVAEYQPPGNVVPMGPNADLAAAVSGGELAACVGTTVDHPDVAPLIPDAEAAGFEALRRRGLYPINHLVVVRDELLAEYPGLAGDVFRAFAESKNRYLVQLRNGNIENLTKTDLMHQRVAEITGNDPLPYGIAPNRAMIDQLMRHAVTQRILDRPIAVEDLFAEGTHNLIG